VFIQLNEWFAANLLSLSFKKSAVYNKTLLYMNYILATILCLLQTLNTKFVGLVTTNTLCWKDHITQLTPKLCKTCCVLRCIRPFMSQDTLKYVCYSYFHSLIQCGTILWVDSSSSLQCLLTSKEGS